MASSKQRENLVFIAKLTQQVERYEDMVDAMNNVARLNVELTAEERDLLYDAYKNVVVKRRASWRILSLLEKKEESKVNKLNVKRIKEFREKLESELITICTDIITIIDQHLLPQSSSGESNVIYYKMKGDGYRYLAELKSGHELEETANKSLKAYQEAYTRAETELPAAHPIRLGLALNFSVFYYEILNSRERAYHLAVEAVDAALSELVPHNEETSKDEENSTDVETSEDSSYIIKLMRENITLWTPEVPKEQVPKERGSSSLLKFKELKSSFLCGINKAK
ncbi:14-3-3-like protein C [Lotus japonicus]|uniref:14-3-3-like protein C n=1 Tax=Lotus japonicus TaxID=34305 RepID=UPI0025904583|nr:14-3-3-like protein C [Lotus japonicus]